MKIQYLLLSFLLFGCGHSSILIKPTFPEPPAELMATPPELKTIRKIDTVTESMLTDVTPSNVPLTTMIRITTENMGICHKYRDQILGLQDWITSQQNIDK